MHHPLDGCWAKINRAKKYLDRLDTEIETAGRRNLYGITAETDSNTGERVIRIKAPRALSTEWGITLGEIIHHLRSALDHLVWQLVISNGNKPDKRNGFPVFISEVEYSEFCSSSKLRGVADGAKTIIYELQPFRCADSKSHPLSILNELWNIDKHRTVNLVFWRTFGYKAIFIGGTKRLPAKVVGPFSGPLEDGAEVYRFQMPAEAATPEVVMHETFAGGREIAIDESATGVIEPPIPSFKQLIDLVEGIIDSFVPFFPTPSPNAPNRF